MLFRSANVKYIEADLTDAARIQAVAHECEAELPKVDVLFNVAGSDVIRKSFEYTDNEAWSTMIARNLSSAFWCSKAFLPLMKKAGGGAIVHHGSIDGFLGNPSIAGYSAGKGGLIPLTHVMAHDLAKYNIRVNCVSTGGIRAKPEPDTQYDHARIRVTPAARLGLPNDVAPAVFFLASEGAGYISGANLVIDGGRTATTHGCYGD